MRSDIMQNLCHFLSGAVLIGKKHIIEKLNLEHFIFEQKINRLFIQSFFSDQTSTRTLIEKHTL